MGTFGYLMSFLCFFASGQISNTESELKKLAEENPDLQDAYIAKQKRLKVRKLFVFPPFIMSLLASGFFCHDVNICFTCHYQ